MITLLWPNCGSPSHFDAPCTFAFVLVFLWCVCVCDRRIGRRRGGATGVVHACAAAWRGAVGGFGGRGGFGGVCNLPAGLKAKLTLLQGFCAGA